MTSAEQAHQTLLHYLKELRVKARIVAAEGDDLIANARLTATALQVAMSTLMEAAEYLPIERQGEYLPALEQLYAETKNILVQIHKLENP